MRDSNSQSNDNNKTKKRKKGILKMRKIFKKVVTAVASLAMMAGLVAGMPTMEAKAGALVGTKTIYVVVDEARDSADKAVNGYALNFWTGGIDFGANVEVEVPGWGGGKAKTGLQKVQNNLYKVSVKVYDDLDFGGIQVLALRDTDNVQYQSTATDDETLANAIKTSLLDTGSTEVWIKANADYKLEVTSPVTITVTDEEIAANVTAQIDGALALSATKENKAAYDAAKAAYDGLTDAQKALVPAAKLASLNAAIATIQAAIDAENAAAAGKLVVYVQNSQNWDAMKLYSWNGSTQFFGAWPGKDMTACTKNAGWYSAQFDISAPANIIFNNGDGSQTQDINDVAAGTYWYTLSVNDEGKIVATASTTAPENWVDEAAAEIKPVTPDDTNNGNGNTPAPTPAPTTADATPVAAAVAAVVLMGLAVVVLNTKKANR